MNEASEFVPRVWGGRLIRRFYVKLPRLRSLQRKSSQLSMPANCI